MNKPLISVLIPCYNAENYIKEAVDSALKQTYGNMEVVVVDDGSKDRSCEILENYGNQIIFEAASNRGAPSARNRAFELSKGELIQYLDADDRLLPEKLEKQSKFLCENPSIGMVTCKGYLFGDEKGYRERKKDNDWPDPDGLDSFVYCSERGISTEGPLIRRKYIELVEGFRLIPFGQEVDFHLRLAAAGCRLGLLDERLVEHRNIDDPNRITKQGKPIDQMLKNYLGMVSVLENKVVYDISSEERRHKIARLLYQTSKVAFRSGFEDVGVQGFQKAYEYDEKYDYDHRAYINFFAHLLGYIRVEKILKCLRYLRFWRS